MEQEHWGQTYITQVVRDLFKKAGHIPTTHLEQVPNEPQSSEDEIRLYRLIHLIDEARERIIGPRFWRNYGRWQKAYSWEDWIQEAMTIMVELTLKYDPQRKDSFNRYFTHRLKCRLLNVQKKLRRTGKEEQEPEFLQQKAKPDLQALLWAAINRLPPEFRMLFIRHELEGWSFEKLFNEFGYVLECDSQRSFQRHYAERVYKPVIEYVQTFYTLIS